jgi:hypothetical protein
MKTKSLALLLSSITVGSLIFATWAMMRISKWIVFHDPVWGQMDKEGATIEHTLAEVFFQAQGLYVLPVMIILGVLWLWFLWARFPDKNGTDKTI